MKKLTSYQKLSSAVMMLGVLGTSTAPIVAHATTVNNMHQSSVAKNSSDTSGTWGTAPYTVKNGVMDIYAGTLANDTRPDDDPAEFSKNITKIIIHEGVVAPADCRFLFAFMDNLQTIDGLTNLDTSNVTDMAAMFYRDSNLTSLDVSHFDTSHVTSMSVMFFGDSSLTSLDLSSFDTSNLREQDGSDTQMFGNTSLKMIKLGTKFKGKDNPDLPQLLADQYYTGKWQNVGTGTVDHPNGKNVWTSSEFMDNYDGSKDADTYVWQPVQKLQPQKIDLIGIGVQGKGEFARVAMTANNDGTGTIYKNSKYAFNPYFGSRVYASIKITSPDNKVVYDKAWKGNQGVDSYGQDHVSLSEGSTVEIYHAEGRSHRYATNDNAALKPKAGTTYVYKVVNNRLTLVSEK